VVVDDWRYCLAISAPHSKEKRELHHHDEAGDVAPPKRGLYHHDETGDVAPPKWRLHHHDETGYVVSPKRGLHHHDEAGDVGAEISLSIGSIEDDAGMPLKRNAASSCLPNFQVTCELPVLIH